MRAIKLIPIEKAFSATQINCVIFRMDSISSYGDKQVVSYYDRKHRVCFASRNLRTKTWSITRLPYKGNVMDAHNCISIIHDGGGILHTTYDHHNHPLKYRKTTNSNKLNFSNPLMMTGKYENRVCYSQFFSDSKGNTFFFYRDGLSGNRNLNLKRLNQKLNKWVDVQTNLIDGENRRNAYWQIWIDTSDAIHLSWVWRETPDASSNHDICYAKSMDGGKTWLKSENSPQVLPITQKNADYAIRLPIRTSLANQTSMMTDHNGNPYIASIWKPENEQNPQYMIVYFDGKTWKTCKAMHNDIFFDLKGQGTLQFPLSRPLVLIDKLDRFFLVFRSKSRNQVISLATIENFDHPEWKILDLIDFPVGEWEPTMDSTLWKC